ncbi:hypothetical protein JCM6882_004792 [Rhodosporidiobolus microsporus]
MAEQHVVPFDSKRRLVGSYVAHQPLLAALHPLLNDLTDAKRDALEDKVRQAGLDAKMDGDELVAFETWWADVLESFPSQDGGKLPVDQYPTELHPLVRECAEHPAAIEANRFEWWTQTGTARSKGASSASASRRRTAADLFDGDGDSGGAPASTTSGRSSRKKQVAAPLPADEEDDEDDLEAEDDPLPDEGNAGGAGAGQDSIESLLANQPAGGYRQQHPLPARPSATTQARAAAQQQQQPRGGVRVGQRPPPAAHPPAAAVPLAQRIAPVGAVAAAPAPGGYAAAMRAAVDGRAPSRLDALLPGWVQAYRAAVLQRSVDFRRKEYKLDYLEGWQYVGARLGVQAADVQKVALGEYVDLASLRDYEPEPTHDVPDVLLDLFHLQQEKKRPSSRAPIDPLLWPALFQKWIDISLAVNLLVEHPDEREEDLYFYKEFIERALQTVDPSQRNRVLHYDEQVRKEILLPFTSARLRYLSECSLHDPLYLALVLYPDRSATASASSTSTRPRTHDASSLRFDPDDPVCGRYNAGEDCGTKSVPGPRAGHAAAVSAVAAAAGMALGTEEEEEEEELESPDVPWLPFGQLGAEVQGGDGERFDEQAPSNPLSGIGPAPRLRRTFHWPDPSSEPETPLLSSSLTAAPLPRPPDSVLNDPVARQTLEENPHLFSTHSPLNVAAIEEDLAAHPNKPWVESLLLSLKEGFWPGHSGAAPVVPEPAKGTSLFPKKPEHQRVQRAWAEKSLANGLLSPAFDKLFAGAVVSPQFVLEQGDKERLIDDHAASGLNDGIPDFPTVYDRVAELVRLLRYLGYLNDDFPANAVLVKLDVSDAFKCLLMHPLWQLRQVVAVAYEGPNGLTRVRYHVQFRAAFGSKASPYLWTSFMSAVLFAVASRCPYVDWPMAYMDDYFNVDVSGRRIRVDNAGESRMVPAALGQVMRVWNRWLVPWRGGKADWGRSLPITGISVDLDAGTLNLERSAVERFASSAADFLATPGRKPPLRAWRRLAGWATWALTIRPFARPLLTPVYSKLRLPNGEPRPHLPYTGVYLNKDVRESLQLFVGELLTGEPLSLRDPGLTHWRLADADVLVHCDACTDADDGSGNGLGFWFDFGGSCFHYFSRPGARFGPIQVAETLTVASAVAHLIVLPSPQPLRRLLVRTDSAPCVYAYDSGAAQEPLRSFLLHSFAVLHSAKVDLAVQHISGKFNRTADALSRHSVEQLVATYGRSLYSAPTDVRTVSFAPHVQRPPARLKVPFPPLAAPVSKRQALWDTALEPSSRDGYQRALNSWLAFAQAYRLDAFPSADSLSLFATFRLRSILAKTLRGELSVLAYHFRPIDQTAWDVARFHPDVQRTIIGGAKANPRPVKKAKPLPLPSLVAFFSSSISPSSPYDDLLWAAMAVVSFFTMARAQEVTTYDKPAYRNALKFSIRSSLRLSPLGFSLNLPYHKAGPLYTGSKLFFSAVDALALLSIIGLYFRLRDHLFGPDGFAWLRANGSAPTRRWFVDRLQANMGKEFTGHSFRTGGATWYALRGASSSMIKKLGRWKGDTWEDYVRATPEVAIALRAREAAGAAFVPDPALLPSFDDARLRTFLA